MIWDVSPAIFTIGSFELRYYPLCFIIGFTLGQKYITPRFQKIGLSKVEVDSMVMHMLIGTIIGARLGHCLFYEPEYYLSNPLEILKVWRGGLASHGGFAGTILATYIFARKWRTKVSFLWLFDMMLPPVMLTACLIRIGNFFNSEILGKITDVPWAIIFQRVDPNPRHPAQLYESLGYLIIAGILYYATNYIAKKRSWVPGQALGLGFILSFSFRFFIEFFKTEQVAFERGMSLNMGQWLSIPFVLIGIYLMTGLLNKHFNYFFKKK